jgi:hypothetical protein
MKNVAPGAALALALIVGLGAASWAQNAAQAKAAEAQAKKSAEKAATNETEAKKLAEKASAAENEAKQKAEAEAQKTTNAYRLDFSVNELEDGKKINSRQYSMNSRGGWTEVKVGTRVPVESGPGQFQYLDVGTNIRCRLIDQSDMAGLGDGVSLNATADLSNFAVPEQQGQRVQPVIRQLRIEASTIAALGKPVMLGVIDDPNSKRQFQLEVTVTKLR